VFIVSNDTDLKCIMLLWIYTESLMYAVMD